MGQFNDLIEAEFTPPKNWILSRALSYKNEDIDFYSLHAVKVAASGHKITAKKGFNTDLASTPRVLWNLISPWDVARAAIIHDLLYKKIRQYRYRMAIEIGDGVTLGEDKKLVKGAKEVADKVFHMAMKDADPKVPNWKIYCAWKSVDLFGRWSIKPNENNI